MQQKIPATVITGFLGAGKTTLIRNLLEQANGKRIALIINEFGDLGVDGGLIKGCGIENCDDDDVIELNNGCICCTVADDFLPTMSKLLDREDRPDHIVIETSGLALPQPLVQAFNWPEIKTQVTVDGVITVVDGPAVADGRFAHDHHAVDAQRAEDESLDHESPLDELFEDQITAADLLVISKADLLSEAQMHEVHHQIGHTTSRKIPSVPSHHGKVAQEILLGLGSATEDLIAERKSHHEEHHADGHDHDHDDFESLVVSGPAITDPMPLIEGLKAIIAKHDILRLKGFVEVSGKPMRHVVQAVGGRIDHYYDRPWSVDETKGSRIVVIGLHHGAHGDMDEAAIEAEILALLT